MQEKQSNAFDLFKVIKFGYSFKQLKYGRLCKNVFLVNISDLEST